MVARQKLAAMALQALLLAAAVTACVVIGRGFRLAVSLADAITTSLAVVLMGVDFGLVAIVSGYPEGGVPGSLVGVIR